MEFSKETIRLALFNAEYKCESCGTKKADTKEGYFEIHHKLPIYIACKYFPHIAAKLISSIMNAEVLCCECHDKRHASEQWTEYNALAQTFLGIASLDARAALGAGSKRRV